MPAPSENNTSGHDSAVPPAPQPPAIARFLAWITIALAVLAAPLLLRLDGAHADLLAAAAGSAALGLMLALLETTPRSAIKLPPLASVVILWVGALWLVFAARGFSLGPGLGSASFVSLIVLGVIVPIGGRLSPWHAAMVLWNPALWLAALEPPFSAAWFINKACLVVAAAGLLAPRPVRIALCAASLIAAALIQLA